MGIGGGALSPKNQFRFTPQYASCLAKFWPNYVIFTILFQAWSRVLSPISNLAGLALQSQNMMRAATQENAFGLCVTQSRYFLMGGSLKAYRLCTVSLRSKRFQSSYHANVRAEANSFPSPSPVILFFFFCSCPSFLDETLATQANIQCIYHSTFWLFQIRKYRYIAYDNPFWYSDSEK